MKKSDQINELAKALSQAQSEIRGAHKDSNNSFFKSKYADLGAVWEAIRGPLSKNGLSVCQTTTWEEMMGTAVVTTLMHTSGQWIEGVLPIMAIKQDPQGIGSAISYSRRYALAAIAGAHQTDDDGEGAHGRGKKEKETEEDPQQELEPPLQRQIQAHDDGSAHDGNPQLGNYIIPMGFCRGKKLSECGAKDLNNTLEYFQKSKNPSSASKTMCDAITNYLAISPAMRQTRNKEEDLGEISF